MNSRLPALALVLPLLCAPAPPDEGYGASADAAGEVWKTWELEGRESKACSGDRVLVVCPKRSSASKLGRSADKTVKAFDALFAPEPRPDGAPPRRCAVIVELEDAEELASATAFLARQNPNLAGWAPAAARGVGFALEEPLCAGWLRAVPQNEVWNPENELVNRLARLLTLERFGRQPNWLEMGLAWQLELTVCKDVYCFPYRAGFVSKKEHKRWDARLDAVMAARGDAAVTMEELAGWPRGTWDETRAALAWGAAAMLARKYEEELPRALEAFAAERRAKGRTVHADGSWELIPDYEIPAARQRELLDEALGVDFAAELTRFASAPKTYRRPR